MYKTHTTRNKREKRKKQQTKKTEFSFHANLSHIHLLMVHNVVFTEYIPLV